MEVTNMTLRFTAALVASLVLPLAAHSAGIITNGTISLGVDNNGQLNIASAVPSATGTTSFGLRDNATGLEATADGCLCDGAAIPTPISSGSANNSTGTDVVNISFASDGTTATTVSELLDKSLQITHVFAPAAETNFLYRVTVSIKNTSGADIADLRYTRGMDWDIEPTAFSEFVTIGGTAAATAVLYADDNGFSSPNPFASRATVGPAGFNVGDQTDTGATDHGALFDFAFGALKMGETKTFEIFYGAAPTERDAFAALAAVDAEVYSFGQSLDDVNGGTPGYRTFIVAFAGVGGEVVVPPTVPVPAAGFLLLGGVGLMGSLRLRRKS